MKKLISLLLILCLAFLAASALAEDYTGTWYLVRAVSNGTTVSIDGTGMNIIFTLNADGSCDMAMSVAGQEMTDNGSWTANGNVITITDSTGAAMDVTVENGEFALDSGDGTVMYFSQTAPEAGEPLPAAIKAESLEQFNGSWTINKVTMMGIEVSAEDVGMDEIASLNIQDGKITENAQGGQTEMEGVFNAENGTMVATIEAEGMSFDLVFSLLEDGTLSAVMDVSGIEIVLIYIPSV